MFLEKMYKMFPKWSTYKPEGLTLVKANQLTINKYLGFSM